MEGGEGTSWGLLGVRWGSRESFGPLFDRRWPKCERRRHVTYTTVAVKRRRLGSPRPIRRWPRKLRRLPFDRHCRGTCGWEVRAPATRWSISRRRSRRWLAPFRGRTVRRREDCGSRLQGLPRPRPRERSSLTRAANRRSAHPPSRVRAEKIGRKKTRTGRLRQRSGLADDAANLLISGANPLDTKDRTCV